MEPAGRRAWARGRGRRWELGRAGAGARLAGARTRADAQAGVARATGGPSFVGRVRQGAAAGAGSRVARGAGLAGPGRAAWARGLALGCALGALGLFLARFDSVFS